MMSTPTSRISKYTVMRGTRRATYPIDAIVLTEEDAAPDSPSLSSGAEMFPGLRFWVRLPAWVAFLSMSAGIAAVAWTPWQAPGYAGYWNLAAWILACVGIAVRFPWFRATAFAALGMVLALASRADQSATWERWNAWGSARAACQARGTVVGTATQRLGSYRFPLRLDSLHDGAGNSALQGKVITCVSATPLPASAVCALRGTFSPPRPRANPGGFDSYAFFMSNDVWGTLYVDSVEFSRADRGLFAVAFEGFRNRVMRTIALMDNRNARALTQAAFLGETGALGADQKQRFRDAGIYHLLALSGFNVAMVMLFVMALLYPVPLTRNVKLVVALLGAWLYLACTGPIPSLFRATVMASIVVMSLIAQRRSTGLNALGLAGIVWLILSPQSLASPSFQLSFAATAGLIALTPVLLDATRAWTRRIPALKPVIGSLVVTTASFLATAPIIAYHFGSLSLFGFIANLGAVMVMNIALWAFCAALTAGGLIPGAAELGTWVAQGCMVSLDALGRFAGEFSWRTLNVPLPPLEVLVCTALLLAGAATVRRDLRGRFLLWAGVAVTAIMVPAIAVRLALAEPRVVFFQTPKEPLAAAVWPTRRVWVFGWGEENQIASTYRSTIAPWLRTVMGTRLDAVVLDGKSPGLVSRAERIAEVCRPRRIVLVGDSADIDIQVARRCLRQLGATRCEVVGPGSLLTPAPGCTCRVTHSSGGTFDAPAAGIRIRGRGVILNGQDDVGTPWDVARLPGATPTVPAPATGSAVLVLDDTTAPLVNDLPAIPLKRAGAVTAIFPNDAPPQIRPTIDGRFPLYAGL